MKAYIYYIVLLIVSILPVGCISTGVQTDLKAPSSFREAPKGGKVYKPAKEWEIRSEKDLEPLVKLGAKVTKAGGVVKVNLNGITIDGTKQKGDGGQSERQTPLFRARIPLMVENGFFNNNKNAATFYKPNSGAKNITLGRIGEDGLATSDGATNFLVQNCEFSGAADKSLQLNEARGAKIISNTFHGGITGVRVGKYDFSSKNDKATCSKNKFINVDKAWNVGEVTLEVTGKNSYQNVRLPFKVTKGAKIKNADGKVSSD